MKPRPSFARAVRTCLSRMEPLRGEALEHEAQVLFMIRDAEGRACARIEGPAGAGIHRVNWDLRLPAPDAIDLSTPGFTPPWVTPPQGPLAPPGRYRVEMALLSADGVAPMASPQEFEVKLVQGRFCRRRITTTSPRFSAARASYCERLREPRRKCGAPKNDCAICAPR